RWRQDCDYYLGNGGRSSNVLWSKDEKQHIQNMKDLHNTFDEKDKPEWLTWEQILEYEIKMVKK
ncbi:LPD11 domain-containing protein, partial [Mycobacterium tuberculosis]|uniref:LPD11 domain-containing protein n=1 Tax=Mycobacterium tuberculosis TaxID=1773 RepID=UPI00092FFD54